VVVRSAVARDCCSTASDVSDSGVIMATRPEGSGCRGQRPGRPGDGHPRRTFPFERGISFEVIGRHTPDIFSNPHAFTSCADRSPPSSGDTSSPTCSSAREWPREELGHVSVLRVRLHRRCRVPVAAGRHRRVDGKSATRLRPEPVRRRFVGGGEHRAGRRGRQVQRGPAVSLG